MLTLGYTSYIGLKRGKRYSPAKRGKPAYGGLINERDMRNGYL